MSEFFLIFGMFLVTFGVRYPVLAVLSKTPMPEPVFKALRYVPPVVLTAIIVPAVLLPEGEPHLNLDNAALVASLFAVFVARTSKNLLLTIVLGMAFFWLWPSLLTLFF